MGAYPDKSYYGYKSKRKVDCQEFSKWYENVQDKTFNFQEEFISYCKQDVIILREGCISFRNLFIKLRNLDPFVYFTLPQV